MTDRTSGHRAEGKVRVYDQAEDVLIATIPKNSNEELRIVLAPFRGHHLLSMRVWYRDKSDTLRPGKQGLALRVSKIPDILKAITDAQELARSKGLLDEGAAR